MENKTFKDYAYLDFKDDRYFYLVNKDKIEDYLNFAIEEGKKKAVLYKNKKLEEELLNNNIKLIYSDNNSDYAGLIIYARTVLTNKDICIEIFNKAIKKKAERLNMDYDTLIKLHLAHEFFHALEYKENCLTSSKVELVYQKILFFKIKRELSSLNEVAANSFAYYYLNETIIPQLTDIY